MRPDTGLRLQTGSSRAWKTSHFLRAWKKQEGICGEERHLDGGGVFAEDPLQAVGDFLARAIGERAQADRAELARVDAFAQKAHSADGTGRKV